MKRHYKDQLRTYTQVLLKPEIRYDELKTAVDNMYDLYLETSELVEDDKTSRQAVYLPTGKAIDSFEAGMCVKEFMRTKKFIAGIYSAILDAQERFPNQRIHIMYAGTGPFGTLMLPMTGLFTSSQIKFTLLEINKNSIDCLKRVITKFDVWDYVEDIIETDASTYRKTKEEPIHMLITETMQKALRKEPHVSITLNLVDQIHENGILIPQNISIDAVLFDQSRNMQRMFGENEAAYDYYKSIGRVIEFNMSLAKKHTRAFQLSRQDYTLPKVSMTLPEKVDKRFSAINLMTEIQVYKDHVLSYYECSLNLPEKLLAIENLSHLPERLELQYKISDMPRFEIVSVF